MKDISPILASLGFTDSETKTYLVALTGGPGTVIDLSKRSTLSRQSSYSAINALTERGLMSSSLIGKKRYYSAEEPVRLLSYAKRHKDEMQTRINDLEEAIPDLSLQTGGERPIVRLYEGKEGIRAIIESMKDMRDKEPYEMTDTDAMLKVIDNEDLVALRKQITKRQVKIRGIYSGTLGKTTVDVERFVLQGDGKNFGTHIAVYGDTIAMVDFSHGWKSISIANDKLAKTMKLLFKMAIATKDTILKKE